MVSSAPSQLVGTLVKTVDEIETPGIWRSRESSSLFVVRISPKRLPLSGLIRNLPGPFELTNSDSWLSESDLAELAHADGINRVFPNRPTSDGSWLCHTGAIVSLDCSAMRSSPSAVLGRSPYVEIISAVQPAFFRLSTKPVPEAGEKRQRHLQEMLELATRYGFGSVLNF